MSNVFNKLRERVVKRKQYCKDRLIDSISKHGIQGDANEYQLELVMLNEFLRWIDELSTSDDEQTQPGLLPCLFCGGTPRNSSSEDDCGELVHKVKCECGGEFVSRGETEQSAEEGWNTRANKTQ